MIPRCIFITITALLGGCLPAETPGLALAASPPENRALPRLPLSDAGLAPDWFAGAWRVADSACTLRLDADAERPGSGFVTPKDCTGRWNDAHVWRRPDDRSSLFDIRDEAGRTLWRAFAIQPAAIAGVDGEGVRVRLHWAETGTHGGWVQPERETGP